MGSENHIKVIRFARTAVLSALAVVLSFLEGMLPDLPIPGAKFGLANLAVMTSIDIDGLFGGLCVSIVKSGFAVFTRGPTAGVMSLCGSVLSTFVMWLILRYDKNKTGYVGVGICGAVGHNVGQMCVARIIMGDAIKYYVPFLLIIGLAAGAVTGTVNSVLIPALKKVERNNR